MINISNLESMASKPKLKVGATIYNDGFLYMVITTPNSKYAMIDLERGMGISDAYDTLEELASCMFDSGDIIVDCDITLRRV